MLHSRSIALSLALMGAGLLVTHDAQARDYIADASAGCVNKGGEDPFFCTIQAAVEAAHVDGGGEVQITPGVYREVVHLYDDVSLQGDSLDAIIELPSGALPQALLTLGNRSDLRTLTLRLPVGANANIPVILMPGVEDITIEDIVIDGGLNRGSVGLLVQNQLLDTSRIRKSELHRVEVGIEVEDARFRITRNLFQDILRDAIYSRLPVVKQGGDDNPNVGDDDDLELSGFNRFRNIGGFLDDQGHVINEGDSFLLRNTTGAPLTAQLNDWGIYDTGEIGARISENPPASKTVAKGTTSVTYEPYLGKSLFPGSVFARIRDAVSLGLLSDATPRLLLNAVDTQIDPAFDSVSKLYSFTFLNPNTYSVLAQAPAHSSSSGLAVVGPGEIVALELSVAPIVGGPTHTADLNGNHKIDLSELLRVVQFFNTLGYHCEVGTEDGFGPYTGATGCTPHAADYAPQDWKLSLSEVLRMVQFYNMLGYYACPGSEDGFCPGAP